MISAASKLKKSVHLLALQSWVSKASAHKETTFLKVQPYKVRVGPCHVSGG